MSKTPLQQALVVAVTLTLSPGAWAVSECPRPVKSIWDNTSSGASVWVTFSDGGSSISKTEAQLTSGQMSRFVALAMVAQTTGKPLIVRYPEDGVPCPPPAGDVRTDVVGVWLTGS